MNLNFGASVAPLISEFISDKRNYENSKFKRIGYRIGINLNDLIVQDDGKYGDGVNVVARLEGLAKLGGTADWRWSPSIASPIDWIIPDFAEKWLN